MRENWEFNQDFIPKKQENIRRQNQISRKILCFVCFVKLCPDELKTHFFWIIIVIAIKGKTCYHLLLDPVFRLRCLSYLNSNPLLFQFML